MLDLVIVGAGGCGREVYDMAEASFSKKEYQIKGFLSDDLTILDRFPEIKNKTPLLGKITEHIVEPNERFLLAIGSPAGRKKVSEILLAKGAEFLSLIHPSAQISSFALMGKGIIVYPFVFVGNSATIKDFCLLNVSSVCGHDSLIEKFSVLCPGAAVLGGAQLGEAGFMAANTTLAPGKKLGQRTIVSANSAALRNAADDAFIIGVPGKNM